jgi:hypothetical protein
MSHRCITQIQNEATNKNINSRKAVWVLETVKEGHRLSTHETPTDIKNPRGSVHRENIFCWTGTANRVQICGTAGAVSSDKVCWGSVGWWASESLRMLSLYPDIAGDDGHFCPDAARRIVWPPCMMGPSVLQWWLTGHDGCKLRGQLWMSRTSEEIIIWHSCRTYSFISGWWRETTFQKR